MARTGKNLYYSNDWPIQLPGRSVSDVEEFLQLRPDFRERYIYDVGLATGQLLYSCAGGIGATKERYITLMHRAIAQKSFVPALKARFSEVFGDRFYRNRYFTLRGKFNLRVDKMILDQLSFSDAVDLYLLWCGSAFLQRYEHRGYVGIYAPILPKYDKLAKMAATAKRKQLIFRREDIFSFQEGLLHDEVVIYRHLPDNFGRYGSDFVWNRTGLINTARSFKELDQLGHKVCVSWAKSRDRSDYFADFHRYEASHNVFCTNFA